MKLSSSLLFIQFNKNCFLEPKETPSPAYEKRRWIGGTSFQKTKCLNFLDFFWNLPGSSVIRYPDSPNHCFKFLRSTLGAISRRSYEWTPLFLDSLAFESIWRCSVPFVFTFFQLEYLLLQSSIQWKPIVHPIAETRFYLN